MKNIPPKLAQHFLKNSPSKIATQSLKMMPYASIRLNQIPNDYMFIEQFLFKVNCDYLVSQQYHYGRPQSSKLLNHLQKPAQKNLNIKQTRKNIIQTDLIQSIKKLNLNKDKPTVFLQVQQIVQMMSGQQANRYKKYLIYLYKWTINEYIILPNITQGLNQQLKKRIVQKIYEGHQKKQQRKIVQEQLKRIQTLAKARESLKKGDSNLAKLNYEAIFQDQNNDPNSRMEALQYLCKQSIEKGDEGYLLGMMTKIPDSIKEQRHKKYIQNTIQKINKSNVPKLQVEKAKD